MAYWRKSYDFSSSAEENELDSSDESESDENLEAARLYHRRKSTAIAVKARLLTSEYDRARNSVMESSARSSDCAEHCIKEGFLMKQSGSFQRWKRRYFKLREGKKLFYAKHGSDSIFNEIDLQDLSVAESSIKNVNNSFTVITPFRSLILCAENRKEMEEWISSLKSVDTKQTSQSELMDVVSGSHNWYSCSHGGRPTFCNVCRDLLSGVTSKGLSCEVCKFKVHKRCAVRASNKCKWTTFQSVKRWCANVNLDQSDPMSMPHQWFEGNLPPGVKCAVCNIPCGSKRRLQDWNCLWCNSAVHSSCKGSMSSRCSLGENAYSILPPLAVKAPTSQDSLDIGAYKLAPRSAGSMPLLVFVNSKSGDNQGVKFIRKFKQLLNPLQVFDLGVGGPTEGLKLFQSFDHFRILICGGDGSVGWVMNEVDKLKISKKCQLGVLPLGTGNDLSRVLGWGTTVDDDSATPQFLQHLERAKQEMLDRWSIMVQEGGPGTAVMSRSSSNEMLDTTPYRQEIDNIDMFENSVATHLTRIMHSSQHAVVISSAKVLCETVKHFVSKVGVASASSDPDGAEEPGSLAHKCSTLNEKLNLLLKTLSIESEALPTPAKEDLQSESWESCPDSGPNNNTSNGSNGKQKVFVPRDALMSRANSLKKALKQIIEHTEKAVDEQNAQSGVSSSLAEAIVTAATTAASDVMTTSTLAGLKETGEELLQDTDSGDSETGLSTDNNDNRTNEKDKSLKDSDRKSSVKSRCISRGSSHPYHFEPPIEEKLLASTGKGTIQFNGCIIARAFLKERNTEGIVGSLIGKALLANADALCAPVTPMMNDFLDVEGFSEKCIMNNYFGIGLDAKITLDFHLKREEHPEKHRSRTRNMLWYGVLGGKEIVQRTYKNLDQRVHLECDGHKINLPSLQGIVVLNIPSYMGGANFWGTRRDDGFTGPSFDDNILEVVAVLGAHQMGMSKVFGGMQNHRIAQCRAVKITIKGEPVPVQVDGEAWMQPPGYIKIVHKNRAQMLVRDREFETTLREWEREKNMPAAEVEGDVLIPLAEALFRLVNMVKEVCCSYSDIEQDLHTAATSASAAIDKVFPDGRLCESTSRTRLQEFVATAKSFTQEVVWFLNEKAPSLIPPLSAVLESRVKSCVSSLEPDLVRAIELYGLTSITDEEVEKQQVKGKSKFRFGFRSKKPEISKSSTAPAGRMIQFWGVEEVGMWLENIGLPEYKELFAKHDIRGNELLGLDRPDLKELGVDKVGHVKRITSGIKVLCGGASPKAASRIERTTRVEEKTGPMSSSFDREDSH